MRRPKPSKTQQQAIPKRRKAKPARPTIRLYHFTAYCWWEIIRHEGITRGEVQTSLLSVAQYPNLTSDPDADSQVWCEASLLNKTAIRIAIDFDADDPLLVPFAAMTKQIGMDPDWHLALDRQGGHRAKNWWIYKGPIRPNRFAFVQACCDPDFSDEAMIKGFQGARRYADIKHGVVISVAPNGKVQGLSTLNGEGVRMGRVG